MRIRLIKRYAVLLCLTVGVLGLPVPPAFAAPTSNTPLTYVYDEAGRLEAVVDPTLSAAAKGLVQYNYDDVGNLLSVSRADATVASIVDFHAKSGLTGATVTIYGSGFDLTPSNDVVKFNWDTATATGKVAIVTAATATTLTATVPSTINGTTNPIHVKNSVTSKTDTSTQSFTVLTASPAPTITSFSPSNGAATTSVTVNGTNFSPQANSNVVTFNDTRAVVTSVASNGTSLTSTVPGAATSGSIRVRTADGTTASSGDFIVPPSGVTYANITTIARMNVGDTKTPSLANGKSALYLVHLNKGDWVTLQVTATTGTFGSINAWSTTILDPLARQVSGGGINSASNFLAAHHVPEDGDYSLLFNAGTCVGCGGQTVTFTVASTPPIVGSDITPTSTGVTVSKTPSIEGQWVTHTFEGIAGHSIRIKPTAGNLFTNFVAFKPSNPYGTVINESPNGYTLGSPVSASVTNCIVYVLAETGQYRMVWTPSGWPQTDTVVYTDLGVGGTDAGCTTITGGPGPSVVRQQNPLTRTPAPSSVPTVSGWTPSDPEAWTPDPDHLEIWTTGRAASPYESVPLLTAGPGATAIAGRALKLDGSPLVGATVSGAGVSTLSDDDGRFLVAVPAGHIAIKVDGSSANTATASYGEFEISSQGVKGVTTALQQTVWVPKLDVKHSVHIASVTHQETVITNASMPGFQVVIPKGARVTDEAGRAIHTLSLTPIPIDRTPYPIPDFNPFPMHFTLQPSSAYVDKGFRIIYPNYTHLLPRTHVNLWDYDPDKSGWYVYSRAKVSTDGASVAPQGGVRLWSFEGASFSALWGAFNRWACRAGNTIAGRPNLPGYDSCGGEPVDMSNGTFGFSQTDLVEPGPLPIVIQRAYRQNDVNTYSYGLGVALTYDMSLRQPVVPGPVYLYRPGEKDITFNRVGTGSFPYEADPGSGIFSNAILDFAPPGDSSDSNTYWVRRSDGTDFYFVHTGLMKIRDRFGNSLIITRDGSGLVSRIDATPSGRWVEFSWTGTGVLAHITSMTDSLGRAVNYGYQTPGGVSYSRLTSFTDPIQTQEPTPSPWHFGWDPSTVTYANPSSNGSPGTYLESVTDPNGNAELQTHFDSQGRVDVQTLANSGTYAFVYNDPSDPSCPNQSKLTDPLGNITCATFDTGGYMTSKTVGVGTSKARTFTYSRDATSHVVNSVVDTSSDLPTRTVSYGYSDDGHVNSITRMSGIGTNSTTTYEFDPAFQRVSSEDVELNASTTATTTTVFNDDCLAGVAPTCTQTVADPEGHSVTTSISPSGVPLSVQDALGNQTTYLYANGDLSSISDGLGRVTTGFTDDGGRLLSLKDAVGYKTSASYDDLNQATAIIDARGKSMSLAYDDDGNMTALTQDAHPLGGSTTRWTYNSMDLPSTRTDPIGVGTTGNPTDHMDTYTYDMDSNLKTWTDRNGSMNRYCYDSINQVTLVGYGYTGTDGNPSCTSSFHSTTTNTYDSGSRLTQIVDSVGGTLSRTYYKSDLLHAETTPLSSVNYTYDLGNRAKSMTVTGQPAVNYDYFLNSLIKKVYTSSKTTSLTYDGANRPATTTLPNGDIETWSFDAADRSSGISYDKGGTNLGALTYARDPDGRLTAIFGSWARVSMPAATTASATYDVANRMTAWNGSGLTYWDNGEPKTNGSQTYTWNARDQLSATSQGSSSFVYDGLQRRTAATISGATTQYVYDRNENIVQEQDGGGTVTANELSGPILDQTFMRTVGASEQDHLVDGLGSTLALTDSGGTTVSSSFTYEPYGATSTTSSPFAFTGAQNDGGSGLLFLRTRYYDPTRGRFLSEDPSGFRGGPNLYEYGMDSPSVLVDREGTDPRSIFQEVASCLLFGGFGAKIGSSASGAWTGGADEGLIAGAGAVVGCYVGLQTAPNTLPGEP